MQLTEKALRCQELGADKTLSFGCMISYTYKSKKYIECIVWQDYEYTDSLSLMRKYWCNADSLRIWNLKTDQNTMVASSEHFDKYKDLREYTYKIDNIIWHPLNRWRLWYLHRSNHDRKEWNAFDKMLNAFNKDVDLFQKTIIDRQHNDELMDLIEAFLLSLQNK